MSQAGPTRVIIIKKKAKGHAHHGGAWKVAYADFVTAMMALFIVLWLLTQTDQPSRERIASYFRTGVLPGGSMINGAPAGTNPPVGVNIFPQASPAGSREAEQRELDRLAQEVQEVLRVAELDPELSGLSQHARVTMIDEGALIELVDGGDSFLFAVASSELKPAAVTILEKLAPVLGKTSHRLEVHGHTDARPFDPKAEKNNWDLSFERADQARRVLEAHGVPAGQISGVLAHAESTPVAAVDPYSAQNRRIAILVVRGGNRESAPVGGASP